MKLTLSDFPCDDIIRLAFDYGNSLTVTFNSSWVSPVVYETTLPELTSFVQYFSNIGKKVRIRTETASGSNTNEIEKWERFKSVIRKCKAELKGIKAKQTALFREEHNLPKKDKKNRQDEIDACIIFKIGFETSYHCIDMLRDRPEKNFPIRMGTELDFHISKASKIILSQRANKYSNQKEFVKTHKQQLGIKRISGLPALIYQAIIIAEYCKDDKQLFKKMLGQTGHGRPSVIRASFFRDALPAKIKKETGLKYNKKKLPLEIWNKPTQAGDQTIPLFKKCAKELTALCMKIFNVSQQSISSLDQFM